MSADRIFIIDDSPPDRMIFSRCLTRSGVTGAVSEHDSPEEGLRALQSAIEARRGAEDPGRIFAFVDVRMPRMSGFELVERLAAEFQPDPRLRIWILTSSTHPEDLARARRSALVEGLLPKPMSVEQMRELLRPPSDPQYR